MAINFDFAGARNAGATDSQIVEYLRKNYSSEFDFDGAIEAGAGHSQIIDYLQPKEEQPVEKSGDTATGFTRAFAQVPELAYGVGALAGMTGEKLFGEGGLSTDAKNYFAQKFVAKQQENQKYAPSVEFTDALESWNNGDKGKMVDWLQDSAGYVVGQGLQTVATGGIGAIAGKSLLTGSVKEMLGGIVAKGADKIVKDSAGKIAIAEATKLSAERLAAGIGAGAVLQAQNMGMEAGDIYGGLIEESRKSGKEITGEDLFRAWGSAGAAALTETATDLLGLGAMAGRIPIGGKQIQAMTGLPGRAARGAVAAGVGVPIEAGQEYAQTWLEQYGAGADTATPEAQKERINAAAVGGLGGAVVGGGAGLIASPVEATTPPAPATTPNDILASPDTDTAINKFKDSVETSLPSRLGSAQGAVETQAPEVGITNFSAKPFSQMNEFASLIEQEQADIAQKRDELFQRQALQRESSLESADNRVAGAWQAESSQNRLALLDAAYSDPSITNPAEKFLADLGRQFPNNPLPTPEEKRLIAKRESAKAGFANFTEPAEPPIQAAPNEMEGLVKEKKPVTQASVAPNLAKVDEAIAAGYTLDKSRGAPVLKSPAGKPFLLSKSQFAHYKQRMEEQNAARNSVNEAQAVSTGMGNAGQGVEVSAQPAENVSDNTAPEITAADVQAVQDIPTTEKMAKAIEYVGEEEFKRMAEAKIKKYRPSNADQEAMLVEATAIEILAQRTGKSNEPLSQPAGTNNSAMAVSGMAGRETVAGNEPGNASTGMGNNPVPGVLATTEEGGKSQQATPAKYVATGVQAGVDTKIIRQNVEQLIKLRRNARELKLGSHLEIAVTKAKKVLESGTGNAADFKKLAKQFAQKKDGAGRIVSQGDEQIRATILSVANALEQAAPQAKKQQKVSDDLLQRIKQLGGIDRTQALDITGEERGVGGWKFAFKNGGQSLDDLATMLASEGFNIDTSDVDGGVQQLRDMIRSHIDGKRDFKGITVEAQAKDMFEQRDMDDMIAHAEELGIKLDGLDYQQLKDAIYMAEDAIEMEKIAAAENQEEVAELSDAVYDGIVNDEDIEFTVSTPEEVAAWLGEEHGQEGNAGTVQGAVQEGSEAGSGRNGGTAQQEAGTGQEILQSYTAQEVAAREEANARAESEAKQAQEESDRKAQAEREREEVRQRSEGAASAFQLGQSAEDNLSGQGDIFSQPAKKNEEPRSSTPEAESKASSASEQGVAGVTPGQPSAAPQIIQLSQVKNNTKIELDGKTYKAKKLLDAANKRVERFKALLECVR